MKEASLFNNCGGFLMGRFGGLFRAKRSAGGSNARRRAFSMPLTPLGN